MPVDVVFNGIVDACRYVVDVAIVVAADVVVTGIVDACNDVVNECLVDREGASHLLEARHPEHDRRGRLLQHPVHLASHRQEDQQHAPHYDQVR